jgi:acetoacetyl-CoA reductase
VAKKNVTVNTISPGYIGTKMVTAIPEEVLNTKILPQIRWAPGQARKKWLRW